ncbi:MAG: HAD-IA family hydrolase [Gammaproteobacteria bacterium]|nr:HAD-IA family hydrolase [Gammaproteobacteria bacterium]
MIKAVLWDFGGVITTSPFEAFNRFEKATGLPENFIRSINAANPETNAWAQLESSQISVNEFDIMFADEALARGHEVRGSQVLALLSGELREEMVNALRIIRSDRKIGCITNNIDNEEGPFMASDRDKTARMNEVMDLFDVVIESSKVGIRKPDPEIYKLACREMEIDPTEAIFLDDLGINLKPARELGMTTIKVLDAKQALDDLEVELGITLRGKFSS